MELAVFTLVRVLSLPLVMEGSTGGSTGIRKELHLKEETRGRMSGPRLVLLTQLFL